MTDGEKERFKGLLETMNLSEENLNFLIKQCERLLSENKKEEENNFKLLEKEILLLKKHFYKEGKALFSDFDATIVISVTPYFCEGNVEVYDHSYDHLKAFENSSAFKKRKKELISFQKKVNQFIKTNKLKMVSFEHLVGLIDRG